jgi:hypothetical protein
LFLPWPSMTGLTPNMIQRVFVTRITAGATVLNPLNSVMSSFLSC